MDIASRCAATGYLCECIVTWLSVSQEFGTYELGFIVIRG
jgi:hypothetical protein